MTQQQKWSGIAAALLGAAAIATLTLTPEPGSASRTPLLCLFCGNRGGIDAVLNLVLFVPFGFGLRLMGLRTRSVVLVSLLATIAIELLQVTVVQGRHATLGDVVWNTTGGATGAWISGRLRHWFAPSADGALRLLRGYAAVPLLFVAAGAVLLQPSVPDGEYFSQWRPPDAQRAPPHAIVLDARWNGEPFPNGRVADAGPSIERSRAAGVIVQARLRPIARERYLVGVLAAVAERRRSAWRLMLAGHTMRFWVRSRADDLGFRSPGLLVPVAAVGVRTIWHQPLRWKAGETLRIDARRERGRYDVVVGAGSSEKRFSYDASPTRALLTVVPMEFATGYPSDALTLLWLPILFAPLGWWAGHAASSATRRMEAALLPVMVLVVAFVAIPIASRLAIPPALEWGAAITGLLLSAVGGVLAARSLAARSASATSGAGAAAPAIAPAHAGHGARGDSVR